MRFLNASILVSCLVVAGCARPPAQMPVPPPPKVTVSYPLDKRVTDYVDFTGETSAVKSVDVRARVWGYLQSLHFTEGALVRVGDLLFQIDPRPYQALVNQAKAKIDQDKAQLKHNEALYKRYVELSKRGAASSEDLDKSLADRDSILATMEADKADYEAKKLDLQFTRIESPITGRVSRFEVTEGNMVQSGQNGGTLLTTIVSVDPMYVYFDVDERTLLQIRRLIQDGEMKNVNESAFPIFLGLADEEGFPHHGIVNFLDNKVDPGTGTLRVRGVVANSDGLLTPGLFVRCRLPLGEARTATLVAEQALGSDQGQKYVYVVSDANEVSSRPVKIGRLYDGLRVIEDGLSKGDRVVISGLQRVRPGAKVDWKLADMPTRSAQQKGNGGLKATIGVKSAGAKSGGRPRNVAAGN
jgi:RND family efflux transporter MFP subunit